MSKMLVKQLLMSSNYWTLNKTVVDMFGIETAFLLTIFAEAETMMADKDGWFFQTVETIEKMTTLSRYKQDKSIDELVEAGILERDVRGIPAKRYFKLDYNMLSNKIANHLQTRSEISGKQEVKPSTTNKELKDKELKDKKSKDNNTSAKADRIPYKEIIDYLNEKTGKKIQHKSESNRELIRARWNEDYDLEDFKQVIENKVADWTGVVFSDGTNAETYLHPTTLFRKRNFDKYLNQPPRKPKEDVNDPNRYIPKELRERDENSGTHKRRSGRVHEEDSGEDALKGLI